MQIAQMIKGVEDDTVLMLLEVVREISIPFEHKENVSAASEQQGKLRRVSSLRGRSLMTQIVALLVADKDDETIIKELNYTLEQIMLLRTVMDK